MVGNTLKFTPTCMNACIINSDINPISIILNVSSFVSLIFLKMLYAKNIKDNIIKRIIIIPNSSEITETI